MNGLELLIRLARQELEEQQLQLGEIGRARAAAEAALNEQQRGFAAESEAAAADLHALAAFGSWGPVAARKEHALRQRSLEFAQSQIAAQDALRLAFLEMKRLEMAREAELALANRQLQRRADAAADERELMRRDLTAGPASHT